MQAVQLWNSCVRAWLSSCVCTAHFLVPQVATASSSLMVLFSSSAALVSFAVLGRINVVSHQLVACQVLGETWATRGVSSVHAAIKVVQLGAQQYLLSAGISQHVHGRAAVPFLPAAFVIRSAMGYVCAHIPGHVPNTLLLSRVCTCSNTGACLEQSAAWPPSWVS
jgi:hypothetical protein